MPTYPGIGQHPTLPTETQTGQPLQNGKLGPCDLTSVFLVGVGQGSLHPFTARAWSALSVSCVASTGATLTATSIADTYRSYAQQESVFRQRMLPRYDPVRCTTTTRMWDGQKWWLRRGMAPVATPGTSNHGFGIAIDAAVWSGGKIRPVASSVAWPWLLGNAESFGFAWELQSEPWHIRHMPGDAVTQRVLDVEAFLAAMAKP
jgi:hypothetical protein